MKNKKQDVSFDQAYPKMSKALTRSGLFPSSFASTQVELMDRFESIWDRGDPMAEIDAVLVAQETGGCVLSGEEKTELEAIRNMLVATRERAQKAPGPLVSDSKADAAPAASAARHGPSESFSTVIAAYGFDPECLRHNFPHVLARIETSWGSPSCLADLDSLLIADRSGRRGFPPAAIAEIMFLKGLQESFRPELAANPHDPFSRRLAEESQATIRDIAQSAKSRREKTSVVVADAADSTAPKVARADPDEQVIHAMEDLHAVLAEIEQGRYERTAGRLGEILVEFGDISAAARDAALAKQRETTPRVLLGEILVGMGELETHQVTRALCRQLGVPIVQIAGFPADPDVIRIASLKIARMKFAYPLAMYQRRLVVAVDKPFDKELQNYFSFLSGTKAILVYADPDRIEAALRTYGTDNHHASSAARGSHHNRLDRADADGLDETGDEEEGANREAQPEVDENDESLIGLVNKIINDAIRLGASDIHLEAFPNKRNAQVRLRRDGRMEHQQDYPAVYHPAVVSRIKIMSSLDISERRRAQDGKISFGSGRQRQDLRVSTIPTSNGREIVTIRILSAGKPLPLAKLGMNTRMLADFRTEFEKPYGLILVCGPTGSGKTTTLHSVLRELNTPDRKIWTAEDPIEIVQSNLSQVQVNAKIGWTFELALRSFLRADPDVIMIGEIRDGETAKVAVEASMTGHLVLATLHTNSAPETLARLLDLGVSPFNLADAALAVISQRLARRVCTDCGQTYELADDEIDALVTDYFRSGIGKSPSKSDRDRLLSHWRESYGVDGRLAGIRAVGCDACHGSGYRGRQGIYELLRLSPEVRRLIRSHATTGDIFRCAYDEGLRTLRQDGIEKMIQRITDFKEIRSVCL